MISLTLDVTLALRNEEMDDFILMINKWVANNGWSEIVDSDWALACAREVAALTEARQMNSGIREQIHRVCSKHLSVRLHSQCIEADEAVKNTAYTALYLFMARMAMPRLRDEFLAQEAAQRALEAIYANIDTVRDARAFLGFCQMVMMRIIFSESRRRKSESQDITHLDETQETKADDANLLTCLSGGAAHDGSLHEADRQAVRSSFWRDLLNTPSLSALDKKLLVWVYREDMSRQEICRQEKLSRSALDVKLHRARNKICQSPRLYALLVDMVQTL